MPLFGSAKVKPFKQEKEEECDVKTNFVEMSVIRLHTVMKLYGGQRHPRLESYKELVERGELISIKYVPPQSTIIYISHEDVGNDHPDPGGDQMYHLLLLLERLRRGDVDRTDMDAFHSLVYKQNHTTTAEDWKRTLDAEKTFIFYDGFCVPEEKRGQAFRMIPEFIKRCDFMIILAPGCTHFDKIDPRTGRKMNLCYRTYRLSARCVFEMFSSFITTRGDAQVTPALLVRSGKGIPNWISPLECQKLATGTSTFECCANNHSKSKGCRRSVCLKSLDELIETRARSLFASKNFTEARFTICFRNYWCRYTVYTPKSPHYLISLTQQKWRLLLDNPLYFFFQNPIQ